jgi:hypothetical protein
LSDKYKQFILTNSKKSEKMKNFPKNRISELLAIKEAKQGFRFTPCRDFYVKIDIRQKRWGILIRNEQPATTEELFNVAIFFGFKYNEMLEKFSVTESDEDIK